MEEEEDDDIVNGTVGAELLQMINRESDLGWNSTHGGGDYPPLYAAATNPESV